MLVSKLTVALSVLFFALRTSTIVLPGGHGLAGNPTELIKPYLNERTPLQDIVHILSSGLLYSAQESQRRNTV